jgi:hypothetical protein
MPSILKSDYIKNNNTAEKYCKLEMGQDTFQTHTKFIRKMWKDKNTSKTWAQAEGGGGG